MIPIIRSAGRKPRYLPLLVWVAFVAPISSAQIRRVSFEDDVLPIFRQNCIGCQGPSQQNSGFPLDRRSTARSDFMGIVPGSSSTSRLYLRLTGNQFGMQLPPTGPLNTSQLATIRDWIDQGAEWPGSLANEVDRPTANPMAVSLVETLRTGGQDLFIKALRKDSKLVNANCQPPTAERWR